jgi:hypothetical protein
MWELITDNSLYFYIGSGFCVVLGLVFYVLTERKLRKQKQKEDAAAAAEGE